MEGEEAKGNCLAWAARDPSGILSPYQFDRRAVGSDDVALEIKYCGVCYADVYSTRHQHNGTIYPLVPGHEITGVVTEVGSNVTQFKVGDHVGVGTYVNSCKDCERCCNFLEVHCKKVVFTFNGIDYDGTITKGGYSSLIVVHERYCFKIPDGYPLEFAAPLLCAGITVYKPMMHHKMNQPGKSLGVVGLGHMAVKFGKAFGLNVSVFSTSESKRDEAINILGAEKFVLSSDIQQMQEMERYHGTLVGFPSEIKLSPISLSIGARNLAGSVTGGTKDTQSMLEYCAAHKIYPKIELIKINYINEALERMIKNDVKYRFVIDIENSFK
ncbi:Cinnamyl alcohol dehydrogenase [Rhynchospora pubera]|uniref:cinnamyl-alcohol dehydrogenase n=1 Tax=Rhynchospora pubera TaxID=906938 RepID=A0AAV8F182_9POAL|nr:Cinnamyl alcohol dehydrogenase [Rhynchospora pubera]